MTARDLLATATRAGIKLAAAGDRLRVTAPVGTLTPELRNALARQKPALLALLTPADYVTLRPGPHAGLVAPLPALQLLWRLEARGFAVTVDAPLCVRVEPAAALTDADRTAIARWHPHLAALIAYQPPEIA